MSDMIPAISWASPLVMRKEFLVEEGSTDDNPTIPVYRQELKPLPAFRREVAELKEVQELCFGLVMTVVENVVKILMQNREFFKKKGDCSLSIKSHRVNIFKAS